MKDTLSFEAEVKEVKTRKTVSLDMEHSLRIVTSDISATELAKLPADCTVDVTIKIHRNG